MKVFEKTFLGVQQFIRTKDKRLKKSKFEIALAKQEFLSAIKELAEEWFDGRIKRTGKNANGISRK